MDFYSVCFGIYVGFATLAVVIVVMTVYAVMTD